jgi:hypothetical protein
MFWIKKNRAFKVYITGNEYKLIPEKIKFSRQLSLNLVLSMLLPESIEKAYGDTFGGAEVKHWLFGALDPEIFIPGPPFESRPVDICYRRERGVAYLGHRERESIAELFQAHPLFSSCNKDISLKKEDRLTTEKWARFLAQSKFNVGCEAGSDYFDPSDSIRIRVNAHLKQFPETSFEEIKNRFFPDDMQGISGRVASSGHFEPAGTKTAMILYEGCYSNVLEPNLHYIELKKDHSNIFEVSEKMKDKTFVRSMIEKTYQWVIANHTYKHRVQELEKIVETRI